jgi:hypothetical protein
MALVAYSDSDSDLAFDDDEAAPRANKKARLDTASPVKRPPTDLSSLPPLPGTFHDLYASTTRVSVKDDPSLHGGRRRVIPHVEGNWPTHLYLECKIRQIKLPSSSWSLKVKRLTLVRVPFPKRMHCLELHPTAVSGASEMQ